MPDAPEYVELASKTGISPNYAHEILNGKRTPSRPLAIHIYRRTGRRLAPIVELSDEQIALLEQLEPYQERAA